MPETNIIPFVSDFLLTLTEMFKGLQSDYVVFITPPDKVFSYVKTFETFAIKDTYSYALTSKSSGGEVKVILMKIILVVKTAQKQSMYKKDGIFVTEVFFYTR